MVRRSSLRVSCAMSTSPTSKPASPSSPEDGPETEPAIAPPAAPPIAPVPGLVGPGEPLGELETRELPGKAAAAAAELRRLRGPVEIELEVSRQRSIGWAIGGTALGIVLIMRLGTVGVWAGIALLVWGVIHALLLARTFVWPVGTIVVGEREVSLPRGPYHHTKPLVVKPSDVTAVYLLRKSVPWNTAAPVLVVELGERAM